MGGEKTRIGELEARVNQLELELAAVKVTELAFEQAGDLLSILGPSTEILYANEAHEVLLGWQPGELVGRKGMDLIHPEDHEMLWGLWKKYIPKTVGITLRQIVGYLKGSGSARKLASKIISEVIKEEVEYRIMAKSGEYHWLRSKGTIVDGKVYNFSRDITKEKKALQMLAESEENYRALFENSPDAVVIVGLDGKIIDCNPQALSQTGLEGDGLVGKHYSEISIVPPECVGDYEKIFAGIKEKGSAGPFEVRAITRHGEKGWVEVYPALVEKDGEPHAFQFVSRDITPRKKSSELVRVQRDLAIKLNSAGMALDDAIRECLDAALSVSGMESGGIYLVDNKGWLRLKAHKGLPGEFISQVSEYSPDTPNARFVMEKKPVYTSYNSIDSKLDNSEREKAGLKAIAVIPVTYEDSVVGCINVSSVSMNEVPPYSRNALEMIAAQTGSSVARIKAEESMRESEKRFRNLAESVSDGVSIIKDGEVIFTNKSLCSILGEDTKAIMGMKGPGELDLLPGEEKKLKAAAEESKRDGKPPEKIEYWIRRRSDGETICIENNYTYIGPGKGGFVDRYIITRDITGEKRAKQALIEDRKKFMELAEFLPLGIFEIGFGMKFSEGMVFSYVNSTAIEMFGYSKDDISRVKPEETVIESERNAMQSAIGDIMKGGESEWHTYMGLRKDGSEFPVRILSKLIVENGRPAGIRGVIVDMTKEVEDGQKRAKLEEEVMHMQKMEALGILAGGVAHDFNNQLQGIIGMAELIDMGTDDNEVREYARLIKSSAMKSVSLTKQLLGYARKGKIKSSDVDMHNQIHECAKLLSRTIDQRIVVSTSLGAPVRYAVGDPDQLQQVLMNLAVNAKDAMPSGGNLEFRTENVDIENNAFVMNPDAKPGKYLMVAVKDSGEGIPQDVRNRIFDPFFTTKPEGKGTGMGLSMVYGTVMNHHGFFEVDSEDGKGTEFRIYLPCPKKAPQSLENPEERIVKGSGKVLIVEDNNVVKLVIGRVLDNLGYDAVFADNGEAGCMKYEKEKGSIDLVILDMNMPVMSGLDCLREIREMNPDAKILISTGYGSEGDVEQARSEGALGYLPKPFTISKASQVVARAIRGEQCFDD